MPIVEKNGADTLPLVRYAETTPLFTLGELRRRYRRSGGSDRSLRNVLHRLKRQKRIRMLARGVYAGMLSGTPLDRFSVPSKLRADAAVAFHSALEFHGVANQVFKTVYYVSNRPRNDVVYGNVTYHRVAPPRQLTSTRKLDFQVKVGPHGIRVTGRERSFIDCLLYMEYSGGADELDRCLAMFPSFNFESALQYLAILSSPWVYARLGYLLDRHGRRLFFTGEWRYAFLGGVSKGVAYLGPKRRGYQWVPTWKLMVPPSLHESPESQGL